MDVHITIIGLDRRSASIGLALKHYQKQAKAEHTFTIIGSDPKATPMKIANSMGAIDNFHRAVSKAIENANLIILNPAYGSINDLYATIGPELKPGTVVLDMSPLKQPVIESARRYFPQDSSGKPRAYLVGITPIESVKTLYDADAGVETARVDLFVDTECLVAPDYDCPGEAIALAEDIIRLIGAKARFMDPVEHDGLIAATEGLPELVGAVLFYTLHQSEGWTELRRMVNPTLALAIQNLRYRTPQDLLAFFMQNRLNLARHLEAFIGVLDQMRDALANENHDEIEAFLMLMQNAWEKWDIKRHSGKWEEAPEIDTLPGPFGFLTMSRRPQDRDSSGKRDDA